jgi:DNA modification methylase
MYQDSVKVPIGDWAKKRFKSMTKNDFIRYTSKTNNHLGRNVSNWLKRKRVFPHNVIVFEEEHYDKQPSNVIDEIANYAQNGIHSATFPIELPTWFIKLFTQKNNLVLDPFSGVGTTCQAALLLERKYIGIEILSKFVNEANKNLEEVNKLKK